jgi:hypothetical protein
MRDGWIGSVAFAAAMALAAGPLAAQQSHARSTAQASPSNPDLDADDQLAPSQMKQPVPAAVSEPTSAPRKPTRPAVSAAAADPAAAAAPAPKTRIAAMAPSHTVVACSGPFAKDSGMLALAVAFDSRNVVFTEEDVSGSKVAATIVYPKDPKKRLEVWWSNPGNRTGTYLILINGKSTWSGPDGMRLGLDLAQLEKLNHKPFKIKGYDKDGNASVSDWDGGALASLPGGCKSGLSMRAGPKVAPDAVSALSPDKIYSSDDPEVRATKPAVSEILIGY